MSEGVEEQDLELLAEFKTESEEHLAEVEPQLLELEDADAERSQEIVHGIFRAVHSVKGASGFFGLDNIQSLSHAMESLLMRVRDGELDYHTEMTDALLAGLDKLKAMIDALPEVVVLPIDEEVARVQALAQGDAAPSAPADEAAPEPEASPEPGDTAGEPEASGTDGEGGPSEARIAEARRFGKRIFRVHVDEETAADEKRIEAIRASLNGVGECIEESIETGGGYFLAATVLEAHLLAKELGLPEVQLETLEGDGAAGEKPAAPADASPEKAEAARTATPAKTTRKDVASETIRVHVKLLDKLMTLAGELVLSRNQLLRGLAESDDPNTKAILQDLDLITSELQGGIMNTRMQPVGIVFNKFNRIVRDLSRKLGKEIALELEGVDVELDKSIIELLSDPLTHLIRNALDHGVETPEERERAGKPRQGIVALRAFHEGGQVHIEIEDDGRGIDPAKTRQIAVARGVMSREEAESLPDHEARALIFAPGFSTADEVSDVSGRGVGMDVVKTNIAKLGGKIDLESEVGLGSMIRIRLPLTLAIIPSLIVQLGEERFAIPQVNLVELVRVKAADVPEVVSEVRDARVLRLRGSLLPLVCLADVLGIEAPGDPTGALSVVVLQVGGSRFGLIVDSVSDSEEIVVKPLSRILDDCGVYAGAAIMGDGKAAMILDAAGMAAQAQLDLQASRVEDTVHNAGSGPRRRLVLFTNAEEERFAVDLASLLRLERIERSQIERVGPDECIEYRGQALPLTRLEDRMDVRPIDPDQEELFVLIPREDEVRCGILAGEIIDTIETEVEIEEASDASGAVAGRAVIDGHLTLLVDAARLGSLQEMR